MQVEIRSEDLKKLAVDLRGQDNRHLRSKLTKGIREPLKEAQREVRGKIRAIPSKGTATGGHASRIAHRPTSRSRGYRYGTLRSRMSAAVAIKVRTSGDVAVRLYMDRAKLPADQRNLPPLMEGLRPWRHEVFGHDVWVTQKAHPYFFATLLPYKLRVQEQMLRIADEVIHELVTGKQGT